MENKRYLDKVLEHLVRSTKIDYEDEKLFTPFLSPSLPSSSPPFTFPPLPFFSHHCKNTYGLTDDEILYVWKEYKDIILEKINQ